MSKYGKWIGGGLGFVLGGPIGAVMGALLGGVVDAVTPDNDETDYTERGSSRQRKASAGDFEMCLLVLSAAIMRADGKVLKSELNYVKKYLSSHFGEEKTADLMLLLRDLLKQDIPVRQVCLQIARNMSHPLRLQMLHFLYGIAQADGEVDSNEIRLIKEIARYMRISDKDLGSINAMFYRKPTRVSDYQILEVPRTAGEKEIKKAYRKMVVKYHPDKVVHLGPEYQKGAKEKFQKVQDAYERIKESKGFN